MNRAALSLLLAGAMLLPAASASAATFVYQANLSGDQEVPVVVTSGTGFSRITYDDVLHTLRVEISFSGLTGLTTAAHIHRRVLESDQSGPVMTQTPTFADFPLLVSDGSYDNVFDLTLASSWNPAFIVSNGGLIAGAEAAFAELLVLGRTYVNIHTNAFPGGEIRGDLTPAGAGVVPEPTVWALMLLGFGSIGAALRRRLVPLRATI